MKILIMNDFLLLGGAEIYTENLANLLEKNKHDVYIITFDNEFEEKIDKFKFDKNKVFNFKFKNKISKLLFEKKTYSKLKGKIEEIKPDKIIVNNFFSSPITQYKVLAGYEAFQVVHDYSFICPNLKLRKSDANICKGYKYENCIKNCTHHNSKLQLLVKLYLLKKIEKLRKKYIKKFIVPSQKLTDYLLEYGFDAIKINNPVYIKENILKNKTINNRRNYIYVGLINEGKGIFKFLDVYDKFSKNHNVNLTIIGKTVNESDEAIFSNYLTKNSTIKYLGYLNHDDVENEMKKNDFTIVTSYYIENYPTTVLEGILSGTVVLASDVGGTTEILANNRGLLFNIVDSDNINSVLEKSYILTEYDYNHIRTSAFDYIVSNNSFDVYYEKFIKAISN